MLRDSPHLMGNHWLEIYGYHLIRSLFGWGWLLLLKGQFFLDSVENHGAEITVPIIKGCNSFAGMCRSTISMLSIRHYYPHSLLEAISLLNKSPALRCVNPKFLTIFVHRVPFPLPGPPESMRNKFYHA